MDRVLRWGLSRRSTPEIILSRKNLIYGSKVANLLIVDILKYLYKPYVITDKRNGDC